MLAPAHVGHLAMLRTLIRDASAEGSMTAGLAGETAQALEFFAKLKRALVHGYFVEEDSQSRRLESVAIPGYVFWPDDRHSGNPPVGFGLFRALDGGYELWLAGLEFGRRGGGQGRALMDALFGTSHGKKPGWCVSPEDRVIARRLPTCSRGTISSRSETPRHCAGFCAARRPQRWRRESATPSAVS